MAFKYKISRVFALAFFAVIVNASVANAQVLNLDTLPTIDTTNWSVGGNATYITRLNPSDIPIFIRGGATRVSANQFDFDFDQGYEAFIAKSFDGGGKIELKFSSLDSGTATTSSTVGATDSLGTSPPSLLGGAIDPVNLTLDSGIISGELNMYIPLTLSTDMILGYRWIEYDETMVWTWQNRGLGDIVGTTNVDNHLHGIQTGLNTLLAADDIHELSIYCKGGAYLNNADQGSILANSSIGTPLLAQSFDTDIAAVVDFGIKGQLNITGNIALNFGYTGLYFAGLAMAPDQLNTISAFPAYSSSRLDTSSTFYHGGFLGISFNN